MLQTKGPVIKCMVFSVNVNEVQDDDDDDNGVHQIAKNLSILVPLHVFG